MRVHEAAIFRGGANAVRISVSHETGVALFLDHRVLQHANVRLDRFGIDPGEERIGLAPDLYVLNAALAEDV